MSTAKSLQCECRAYLWRPDGLLREPLLPLRPGVCVGQAIQVQASLLGHCLQALLLHGLHGLQIHEQLN